MSGRIDWTEAASALVQAETRPDPGAEQVLDVCPGASTAFDGNRFWSTFQLVYDGEDHQLYGNDDVGEALDAAIEHVRSGGTLRMGNRSRLRHDWSPNTIRAFERKLAAAAAETDGALLTWTVDDPEPDDEELYDVVVRR